MIRIASGSGYWGDWPQAPALQVRSGPIDYLVLDYLAEVTLSLLARQRSRDPEKGYAADFITDVGPLLPEIRERGVKVIANAGGANPRGCAEALLAKAREVGVESLKVGIVTGDDLTAALVEGKCVAEPLNPLSHDDLSFDDIRPLLTGANAYVGAAPIVEALEAGAEIVVTGRCSDPSLYLGPILHEFDIAEDDWDAKAFGTVVGHILECGGQASGGNFLGDWRSVPNLERLGFPIAEVHSKDRATITKHESLGGRVDRAVVKEQLVYEIGDPENYITPDCVADFTTIHLSDEGPNRVGVTGVKGKPQPEKLKVAVYYDDGWMVTGQMIFCWPEAQPKALAAGELVIKRVEIATGSAVERYNIETIGVDACHGSLSAGSDDPPEVVLRLTVRSEDRETCDQVAREWAPLVLTGPPGATGYAAGRPKPSRVFAYWGGLVERDLVRPKVEVIEL